MEATMPEYPPHTEGESSPELYVYPSDTPHEGQQGVLPIVTQEAEPPRIWQDVELELSEQNLFGSRNLPTNPDARLISVWNRVEAASPLALPSLDRRVLDYRNDQKTFLTNKVRIKGEQQARIVFVDRRKIYADIWAELTSLNHPLAQAINKIGELNTKRGAVNAHLSRDQQQPTISAEAMDTLMEDLLLVSHGDAIRQAISQKIEELRQSKN
jgi:hypothetical protein